VRRIAEEENRRSEQEAAVERATESGARATENGDPAETLGINARLGSHGPCRNYRRVSDLPASLHLLANSLRP
jgi:hypothetical protein